MAEPVCGGSGGISPEPVEPRGVPGFLTTELHYLENCESKRLKVEGRGGDAETAAVAWRAVGSGGAEGEAGDMGVGSLPLTECVGWTRAGRGCHASAPPESCLPFPFPPLDNSRPRQFLLLCVGTKCPGHLLGKGLAGGEVRVLKSGERKAGQLNGSQDVPVRGRRLLLS